jgi:hypothetical protein
MQVHRTKPGSRMPTRTSSIHCRSITIEFSTSSFIQIVVTQTAALRFTTWGAAIAGVALGSATAHRRIITTTILTLLLLITHSSSNNNTNHHTCSNTISPTTRRTRFLKGRMPSNSRNIRIILKLLQIVTRLTLRRSRHHCLTSVGRHIRLTPQRGGGRTIIHRTIRATTSRRHTRTSVHRTTRRQWSHRRHCKPPDFMMTPFTSSRQYFKANTAPPCPRPQVYRCPIGGLATVPPHYQDYLRSHRLTNL